MGIKKVTVGKHEVEFNYSNGTFSYKINNVPLDDSRKAYIEKAIELIEQDKTFKEEYRKFKSYIELNTGILNEPKLYLNGVAN